MELRVGTSGYSYKQWKGFFYPEKLPASEMLAFYAEHLSSVEINNTFYRMPKREVLETWSSQVPEDFRFAIKASRRITHFKRLKEPVDEMSFLLGNTAVLGPKRGVLLFQLPPNLEANLPRLEKFLDLVPEGTRAAFEFRHPSWLDEAVFEQLRARNLALVIVDDPEQSESEPELVRTASYGYLRLRRPDYERADLAAWAARIRSQGWDEAFVFFKHEEAGAGPRLAADFIEVARRAAERKQPVAAPRPPRRKAG